MAPSRGSLAKLMRSIFAKGASVCLFLFAWEIATQIGRFGIAFPPPSAVATDLLGWFLSGELFQDVGASLRRVGLGFTIGFICAVVAGLITASSKLADLLLGPIFELFRPIPPLAWIPLAILWFGLGDGAAIYLVFLGAFFPSYSGMRTGINNVTKSSMEVAKLYELPQIRRTLEIVLPQALPAIFNGAVVGMGVAWMVVVTAELVGTQDGLGYAIQLGRLELSPARVISGMLVIGVVGYVLTTMLGLLKNTLLPWFRLGVA